MYTGIIWGMGKYFREVINAVRLQEFQGNLKIAGVSSDSIDVFDCFLGYPYYDKEELKSLDFDFVIVCKDANAGFKEAAKQLHEKIGVPYERILNYRMFMVPCFCLEKFLEISKNPVTIFSNNCWGTFTYDSLSLPFTSPFINLYLVRDHYLRFLHDPKGYMDEPVRYVCEAFSPMMAHDYPVGAIGDVEIHFLHYKTFEEAVEKWETRKQRINWDNLLVEMASPREEEILEFAKLPYEKKICFAPFALEEECVLDIGFLGRGKAKGGWKRNPDPFTGSVFTMARGQYCYYDALELLHSGKIRLVSQKNSKL